MMRDEPEWRHEEDEEAWSSGSALMRVMAKENSRDVYDASTGQILKGELVAKARQEEMQYFQQKDVWTKRPRQEA